MSNFQLFPLKTVNLIHPSLRATLARFAPCYTSEICEEAISLVNGRKVDQLRELLAGVTISASPDVVRQISYGYLLFTPRPKLKLDQLSMILDDLRSGPRPSPLTSGDPAISIEDLRKEMKKEKISDKAKNIIAVISKHLMRRAEVDRSSLLPEEREFLLKVADWLLPQNRYDASNIFRALHDFSGLRRTAQLLVGEDSLTLRQILNGLEEYDRLAQSLQPLIRVAEDVDYYRNTVPAHASISLEHMFSDRYHSFEEERGYKDRPSQDFFSTASSLSRLSSSYDLVVSIARGGLYSGAMAELLGLNVKVLEVHAHNRKRPRSRFVDEIRPEEIAGKRVLLVDKDIVSGASIKEAVRKISCFGPAAVGVYLNHNLSSTARGSAIHDLTEMGIELHDPSNTPAPPFLDLFYTLHERLETPLGRLRTVLHKIRSLLSEREGLDPRDVEDLKKFIQDQEDLYFSWNHFLPGMEEARLGIIVRMESLARIFEVAPFLGRNGAVSRMAGLARSDNRIPVGFVEALARGRYLERGRELAMIRGVKNEHLPNSYLTAFRSAQEAARQGYDIVVIVGPEGFAYEPIFEDLGLPALAFDVPESDYGGDRSVKVLDDLVQIEGKRVLVVEDDVRSGATLRKLLEVLAPHSPKELGLYLGARRSYQVFQNIPPQFQRVHFTEDDEDRAATIFLEHLNTREVLFKRKVEESP